MAPLTLVEKYHDLIRYANQPISSYEKLNDEDYRDVMNKLWPFIIESISYTPVSFEKNNPTLSLTDNVQIKLDRRLKIKYQLYSEIAKEYQQDFPNRKPIHLTRDWSRAHNTERDSLSLETTSVFSIDNAIVANVPDFYVFCPPERVKKQKHQQFEQFLSNSSIKERQKHFNRVKKYLSETLQTSPYKELVFKQAIKECCRCGHYALLESLCSTVNISIHDIYFDNYDTILHESIKLNNKQLTSELIQHGFDINIDGILGTPLVTAIHYDILWAVEFLLNHGADLTKRHIDWPFLTLYEYCIEFSKIDIKVIIDKHIQSFIRKHDYTMIMKLIKNGWKVHSKQC